MRNICKIFVAEKYLHEVCDMLNEEFIDKTFNSEGDIIDKNPRYPFIKVFNTNRVSTDQRIALVTSNDEYCYKEVEDALHRIAISVVDLSIIITYNPDNFTKIKQFSGWIKDFYLGDHGVTIRKRKVEDLKVPAKVFLSIYIPEIKYEIEKQIS